MNSRTRWRRSPTSGAQGRTPGRTVMPIPQVNDRIKEAPVVVLRAVFAGIGQILLTADKGRARAAEQVWTPDRTPAPGPASQAGIPSTAGPRNGTVHAGPAVAGH